MRAVQVVSLDGPSAVVVADVADPEEPAGGVVVDVAASAVTFPDVLLTRGEYQLRPDLPFVPGSSVAGTVASATAGSGLRPGQRVAAFPGLGGFAERVALPDRRFVFPLPEGLDLTVAAALPMNTFTAHFALTRRAALRPGETVLVHGAAGGLGTACVQLAAALGARVLAVTSTPEKAAVARQAGAAETLPVEGFREAAAALTDGRGVDVVVDPVGGDRFTDSLRSLAPEGQLLVLGFTGREIPTVKVNRLLLNNISVVGVGWGAFFLRDPDYLQEQWAQLRPLVEAGAVAPIVTDVRPLADAPEVLRAMDERGVAGNVVLTP